MPLSKERITPEQYDKLYKESVNDPSTFWGSIALKELEWFSPWDTVLDWQHPNYKWFVGGKINITHNCLDRYARGENKNKKAFISVDEQGKEKSATYGELLEQVNKFANALKSLGVKKGDRVVLYMPLVIEHAVAMLACARIGAIHSVVFAGFSDKAIRDRIIDSQAKVVITANYTQRRGKKIDLKSITESAVSGLDFVEKTIVLVREDMQSELKENQINFHELASQQSSECEPERMDSEDPLFILYTSGSTGKPKGVLHTTGGYSLYSHYTTKTVFDLMESDIYWCTADPGWITGHSYVVYGPLSVGATSIISEGAPDYPSPDKWWSIIEKYKVSVFYTSPTAIRHLRKYGAEYIKPHDLSSLRILGTVGEPISPEAWKWFYQEVGNSKCALVDTWWQTETGGHMIVALPSVPQKPGSAGKPFFGVEVDIVDKQGMSLQDGEKGHLVIRKPWPSALRTCWGDDERFKQYWNEIPGVYCAGDLAIRDKDGYIQIIGRSDDVINVSGHRIGTAEAESALATHPTVAEAAVIAKKHEIKGQCIKAFVVLKDNKQESDEMRDSIKMQVRNEIGGYAVPEEIEFVEKLPKTRSGKIMRRILRAQESGEEVGDLSTLED
jgi:acetyl-CoA synthetase